MPAVKITNKPVSTPGDQTHFLVTQPELPEGYAPTGQETEEELAELKVESLREIEMDDMVELFQSKFAFDSEPTAESGKPVTSAGIKTALDSVDSEIGELKENLNALSTATSEDVGKALKAKTVTDGKVTEWEFGEAGANVSYTPHKGSEVAWELKAISVANGSISTNPARYKTVDPLPKYVARVSVHSGYMYGLFAYDSSDTYIGRWVDGCGWTKFGTMVWKTDDTVFDQSVLANDYKIYMVFRNEASSNLSESDQDSVEFDEIAPLVFEMYHDDVVISASGYNWETGFIYSSNGTNQDDHTWGIRTANAARIAFAEDVYFVCSNPLVYEIYAYKYDYLTHAYVGFVSSQTMRLFLPKGYEYRLAILGNQNVAITSDTIPRYISNISVHSAKIESVIGKTENYVLNDAIVSNKKYFGKKISIIGDSVDTYDEDGYKVSGYNMFYPASGYDVKDVNTTWWMRVINASNAALEVNASWSGSRVTNTHSDSTYPDFYDRVSVIGLPDVIFVTLGSNDSLNSVTLGDFDFETAYTNLSEGTFRTAYIKGIKALQATYPNAEIVCITEKMDDAYKDSISHIAITLGVKYIDASDYTAVSGVHPNRDGMSQIAALVLNPTDKTLSQSNIPADGKAVRDLFESITGEGDEFKKIVSRTRFDGSVIPWEAKSISAYNGSTSANNARYKSVNPLPNYIARVSVVSGYEYGIFAYNEGEYVGWWRISGWSKTAISWTTDPLILNDDMLKDGYSLYMVFKNTSGTTLSSADLSGVIFDGIPPVIADRDSDLYTFDASTFNWSVGYIYTSNGTDQNDRPQGVRINNLNKISFANNVRFICTNPNIISICAYKYAMDTTYIGYEGGNVKELVLEKGYQYRIGMLTEPGTVVTADTLANYTSDLYIVSDKFGKMIDGIFDLGETGDYVLTTESIKKPIKLELLGTLYRQQAFLMYNGKYYSTYGNTIAVQAADFTLEHEYPLSLGHGNALQLGTDGKAYVSGWDDQTVYVLDLTDLSEVKNTITLPTTGYTTAAIDDLNHLAYIFQRDTQPSTPECYNFIVYDYQNEQIVSTKKLHEPMAAMQAVDFVDGRIYVLNGSGETQKPNGYRCYDTNGTLLFEYVINSKRLKEPEGIFVDRSTKIVYISYMDGNLYRIRPVV